ncbi:hypothetical protein, partial [Microbacterium sp. 13-71-7]|uniref:hypothetical protein n=1 Tax=Microbacterium sp. 13-71-7 TaxID=1970399 RepID=UPI000BDA010D
MPAPLIIVIAVLAAGVAAFFHYPGAVLVVAGIAFAGFSYRSPELARGQDPDPKEANRSRRWRELRFAALPNRDWLLNSPDSLPAFRQRGARLLPKASKVGEAIGNIAWMVMPTRFLSVVAATAALALLTLPVDGIEGLLTLPAWVGWVNAALAYGIIAGCDGAVRRTATLHDPSPGVPFSAATK